MEELNDTRITQILDGMKNCRVGVVGDLMMDRYIWGDVTRISPEAPVPVVEVTEESLRLGGAANVGNNIVSLGGQCVLFGVQGADQNAAQMQSLCLASGIDSSGIIIDPERMTTVKTRVIAQQQHVVRIDHENRNPISATLETRILDAISGQIKNLQALILEDYNKGVMTTGLIRGVLDLARQAGVMVLVDPKIANFFEYRGVTVFKPNLKETSEGLGRKIRSDEDVLQAGKELLERLNADHVLITRSEKGMSLFSKDGSVIHVPTRALHVADVSGAGDTVIATLTMAMAAGATIHEAAIISNLAGGYVVGEVGIVPITSNQILEFRRKLNGKSR